MNHFMVQCGVHHRPLLCTMVHKADIEKIIFICTDTDCVNGKTIVSKMFWWQIHTNVSDADSY